MVRLLSFDEITQATSKELKQKAICTGLIYSIPLLLYLLLTNKGKNEAILKIRLPQTTRAIMQTNKITF